MERWIAKVLSVFGVFLIPFICTLLPVKVAATFQKHGAKGATLLSCLMCFGGGVFFATFILHMGPEVRGILDVALMKPYNLTYPVADLIMAFGFFLVMFMEKLVLHINAKKKQKQKKQCIQFNQPYMKVNNKDQVATRLSESGNPITPLPGFQKGLENGSNGAGPHHNTASCPLRGTGDCCEDPVQLKIENTEEDDIKIVAGAGDTHVIHTHSHEADLLKDTHGTRALVLLVAISLHRIFEGMSIGLQHSTHNVWNLFLAVMCHEAVIGFSLGLEFVKFKWPLKRMILACFLCCLIMPLGAVIGTLITEVGDADSASFDLMNGILQAIATGTFIYVTFFEILAEEMDPHETGMGQPCACFIGFMVMAALCAIPEEDDMLNLTNGHHLVKNATLLELTTGGY